MAAAISVVPSGGMPVTFVGKGGLPMTISRSGGVAVTPLANATPITLVDETGNPMSVFVIPAGGQSGVAVPVTGTASETALASVTIPAGAMGANGSLRITALFSYTNSVNNKTVRVRFGNGLSGTTFAQSTLTTTAATRLTLTIQNRNSAASQIGGLVNGSLGGTASASVTGTIDTTASQTLTISGQLANTGETITLESYVVELLYAA